MTVLFVALRRSTARRTSTLCGSHQFVSLDRHGIPEQAQGDGCHETVSRSSQLLLLMLVSLFSDCNLRPIALQYDERLEGRSCER